MPELLCTLPLEVLHIFDWPGIGLSLMEEREAVECVKI